MKKEEKIWKNSFVGDSQGTPSSIATNFCSQLYDKTNKKVMAKVESSDLNIIDMDYVHTVFDNINFNFTTSRSNVQDFLGEMGDKSKFTFELFLTGTKTKDYKYRFCFLEYGAIYYPVTMAIDEEIVKELGLPNSIITCDTEDMYKDILISILNSKRLKTIIEGLMAIN